MVTQTPDDSFAAASKQGRISSVAARGQRDLQEQVAIHRSLFPDPPVDAAMLNALALSTAFIAPWCTAEQLRVANRASLWVTAEDWRVDRVATSLEEVTQTVAACLAVADGNPPAAGDQLGQLLAVIRDQLAAVAGFVDLQPLWREELERMLTADEREWQWRAAREAGDTPPPTPAEYLNNADNYGASFVNVSHWIATGAASTPDQLAELTVASRAVQQVLRLVNDLASYERDVKSGDLNILMLGVDQDEVRRLVDEQLARCRPLLHALELAFPQEAVYLWRELGFTTGFYHGTDFWGSVDSQ